MKRENYVTELTAIKISKKGLVFLVAKTLKNITNPSLKRAKNYKSEHNNLSHL